MQHVDKTIIAISDSQRGIFDILAADICYATHFILPTRYAGYVCPVRNALIVLRLSLRTVERPQSNVLIQSVVLDRDPSSNTWAEDCCQNGHGSSHLVRYPQNSKDGTRYDDGHFSYFSSNICLPQASTQNHIFWYNICLFNERTCSIPWIVNRVPKGTERNKGTRIWSKPGLTAGRPHWAVGFPPIWPFPPTWAVSWISPFHTNKNVYWA